MVAYLVVDGLHGEPVYTAMFNNFIGKHTPAVQHEVEMSVTIYAGSSLDGKKIADFVWPYSSIVTTIYRGEERIIPNGQTVLAAGDTIIVHAVQTNNNQAYKRISRAAHYANV